MKLQVIEAIEEYLNPSYKMVLVVLFPERYIPEPVHYYPGDCLLHALESVYLDSMETKDIDKTKTIDIKED
jgi:hypothetical protein